MTKESPDRLSPSGRIPNDPNPNDGKGIPFALEIPGGREFNPVYYPDRYTDTLQRDVNRNGKQCGGEDVSIDETKNPEFHANGVLLDGNVSKFRKLRNHSGPVDLITPMTDNEGGMEVIITKAEIGELVGWDGLYKQWQFDYTLDMVATGSDTDEGGVSQVVSDVLTEDEVELETVTSDDPLAPP